MRYENLADRYDDTVWRPGRRPGMQPTSVVPPSRDTNVVRTGPLIWAQAQDNDNRDAVTEMALRRFPALIERRGYGGLTPPP